MDPSDWEQVGSIRHSENNGVMVSNLPLLFANSDITSLMVMTQRQLEKFVLFMVRCSVGEDVRKPWDLLIKPEWWPSKLPFRVPAGLSIAPSHRSMLQKLVERCYQYHGCEFLLQFCRSLVQQKPTGGYKFADNRDGTTSMYNSESGKLLVTFRNENREYDKINPSAGQTGPPVPRVSARPQLLPRRGSSTPSMVVKPDIHDVYLCDRCDMEFNTLSQVQAHERICLGDDQAAAANSPQAVSDNEGDLPDLLQDDSDATDQATRMYQLGLIGVGTLSQLPPNSPVKWNGWNPPFQSSVRRVPSRNNYLKFDSVDVSSPLGCLLRRQIRRRETNKNGEGNDPSSVNGQLNVLKYERFLPANPDVQFPIIRDNARGLTRFVNVFRNQKLPWYHTYAFTKDQKWEKILNTEHGLLEQGINLYLSCKPCTVVATRVPKRVIDRETHRQEKKIMPCIDLTEEESKSNSKQDLTKSSLVDQMLNFFRGKCQWALAPGFLEHVISGGNVPNNPVAKIFQQLFSPTGVLVLLLGEAIRNCNWSQHALAEYGTLQLSLEQHNNLLVKLGILNDVAVKFGSSKPMTDLVIKYNFILSNPDEMVRLTTITPDITQVSNSKISSLLSQSNSAKHSPSSSGVAKSIGSNLVSQPGPKFRQNNSVNSIGRKNSNSFASLEENYISTAQIASANRNLSYNVKEFIQAVEKDVSVIDVIDLSSDDESENLKPAKKFKANNSVNNSFNLDVRKPHVRYNNGTNGGSMSSVNKTSTKSSDVSSKNERSHWSMSRNGALGRKATDFPETNGSSSVQTSSKLSNISVAKPGSSKHVLQSLRLSTLPSSLCNNNHLTDSSDLEDCRESFLRDSSEVLDKRKVKRRLINGYDSEYEVEIIVSPSKNHKRFKSRSKNCSCELHGCSCRKYRDYATFSEEISVEKNNNGSPLNMNEVEFESNGSDVYIDEDVTVRLPSPVKKKAANDNVSNEIAPTKSDDTRKDGTASSLNNIFSSFNSYLNKGFGFIRNAVASTSMNLETILTCPTDKDEVYTDKKSRAVSRDLNLCSKDECKELNGVKELMEISSKLGDKRLTRGVSHQNLLKDEFETVAEELPLKIATDAVLEMSDLLSISEVNTRDVVELSFISSNTSNSSGYGSLYQTDLKLSKDIEPRKTSIMDSIKKNRTSLTDQNENVSGDLLEKIRVVNAAQSESAIDVSQRNCSELAFQRNGGSSGVSHNSDSSDSCSLSSESKRSYRGRRIKRRRTELARLTLDEFKEMSNSPLHPKRIIKKFLNDEVDESESLTKWISTEKIQSSMYAHPTVNNVFEILSKEWGPDEFANDTDVEDNTDESEDQKFSSKKDKQHRGKKRKISRELSQLVADECKELKQFGFHPGDVVFKLDDEFPDESPSSSDNEVVVNFNNSPVKIKNGTDNVGSGKMSQELVSLLSDEYKEFKNRSKSSNSSAKDKGKRMIVSKRRPYKTTAPRTAKRTRVGLGFSTRVIQRELVQQENSMCSYTYTLPII